MKDWQDGYLVTVAYQLARALDFDRITAVDPTLSRADFDALFRALRTAGIEPELDGPDDLGTIDAVARPLLERLRTLTERLRAAGAVAFADPADLPDQLRCTLAYPRLYRGVPDDAPLDRVQIVSFTDMPEDDARWQARSRTAACSELRVLYLVSVHLSWFPLDIELGRLTRLAALSLDDNKLTALPAELSAARSLEWLSLNLSSLAADALEPLRALPRLRYLGLIRTPAAAQLDRVRAIVPPGCVIQTVPG